MTEGTYRLLWQDYTGWRDVNRSDPPPIVEQQDYPSADDAQEAKRCKLASAKLNDRTVVATVTPAYAAKPAKGAAR